MNNHDFFSHGQSPTHMFIFTVIFIICWNIENIFGVTKNYNKRRHDKTNLLFILPGALLQFILGIAFVRFLNFENSHKMGLLHKLGLGSFWQVATVFIVLDFTYYLYHYLMHKIKTIWRFHAVHHSDQVMNVSTSLREHPVETGIRVGHYMLAVWILAPAIWIVTLHQFVQILTKIIIHSNFRLPDKVDKYLSLVILTPNMHHVHHHNKQPYTDSNFGDLFSIWDRMFGTFRHLPAKSVCFGLDTAPVGKIDLNFKNLMFLPYDENYYKEKSSLKSSCEEPTDLTLPPPQLVTKKNILNSSKILFMGVVISLLFMCFSLSKEKINPNEKTMGNLVFHLTGLTPNRGLVKIVLYNNPNNYLSRYGFCAAVSAKVGNEGKSEITLKNLPFGKYAGSFYQDENYNNVIDRNIAGLPTEPFGFSNSVRAKWKVPSFESVSFEFLKTGAVQHVQLAYWSKQ